jgi:branched-chain amino acid transport system ATP-binding protein
MQEALLKVQGLSVSYGAVRALDGLSLAVSRGEVVCLIGANGAGKTTCLRALSGLVQPSRGQIEFDGQDLARLSAHRRPGLGLVHCPEGRGVVPDMTVLENLELGAWVRSDKAGVAKDLERVRALFPRLADRGRQKAGTLSGGEQQMLALGRALMAAPKLLMLDEPSLGLAPQVVEDIFSTITGINRQGVTVLLVEQNAHQALAISQRAYVLEGGQLLLHGPSARVAADARVRQAYLGVDA